MKGLVVYYSSTGNNRYLAGKIAEKTGFELEEIQPRVKALFPLIMASLTNIGPGIKKLQRDIPSYQSIILCGPIWMGKVVYPLRAFIKGYKSQINKLHFVSCCGGGDEQKESKFGYEAVFRKMNELLGDKFISGSAMPIKLLVTPGRPDDEVMKTRLNADNFSILENRFNESMDTILKENLP